MKSQRITIYSLPIILFLIFNSCNRIERNNVTIYPAPQGEVLSQKYLVSVEGNDVPVYIAKVAPFDDEQRWMAMDDKKNSADYFDEAAFAYFDFADTEPDTLTVTVTIPEHVKSAKILPSNVGIIPTLKGNMISFPVSSPTNLTIEINGEWIQSLHLFINQPEVDVPDPDDPDVIYFGPGIHEISHMTVGDNKTLYIAGGAIVRAIIEPDEEFRISGYSGLRVYSPAIELQGQNIKVRGRGIIDASGCTTHSRHMVNVRGSNIDLKGIIIRDAPAWTIPIYESDNVLVSNIKLIGYRANSDGIDICNSRNITVENCFIRTLDDLIVIKTLKNEKNEVKNIVAKGCVLWNQVAHALSIGAELTKDVSDVLFTDCDIIHDQGREWSLRIFHTDAARISNVRFENIRIEESLKCISLWIDEESWTSDLERGHIDSIFFKDIFAKGNPLTVELKGFDQEHNIRNVDFQNVVLNGKLLTVNMIEINDFVENLTIQP